VDKLRNDSHPEYEVRIERAVAAEREVTEPHPPGCYIDRAAVTDSSGESAWRMKPLLGLAGRRRLRGSRFGLLRP
jgi:hypothetical protein